MKPVLSRPLRLADLPQRKATPFRLVPDAGQLEDLADRLGVDDLRKVRLEGTLAPDGAKGWALDAKLGATIVQPCRVTTEDVVTRLDEAVSRRYSPDAEDPEDEELELSEEDGPEPLPTILDLGDVLEEALTLSIPAFPRAEGADALDVTAAPEGAEPLTEENVKPFAGLAALKARMEGGGDQD